MGRSRQSRSDRRRQFEKFEERIVMSAQALIPTADVAQLVDEIAPMVQDSAFTTADSVSNNASHGFDGSGQTIAIIDSGIAWDHAALGGGYGTGNKVVGGWDFAENDSNPYDDGPAGFHGTHVAGIAAGNSSDFQGVASGADLVGLRVFNDQGVGKIEWVESALQWVKSNLDSFTNPITTVNMSLGADWQTETVADWNVIEDELAALKSEGVFISVAAGNDFDEFFDKTLNYPAASQSVVPVSSHDASGSLSDFSQRDDHVLVAPGENIDSTVPNHLFGTRYQDQLLGASGTSMASPYVAGASAVLRQAYASIGYGEVDQDVLYQTFWDTSNQIYDSITQTTFRQLDLDAAIESILSNAQAGANQIGAISGGEIVRGTLSNVGDTETFEFYANDAGQLELTLEATESLQPGIEVRDGNGDLVHVQYSGDRAYVSVEVGQTYQLSIASNAGSGHYQVSLNFQTSVNTFDLGRIESVDVQDFIANDRMYSIEASRSGPMAFGLASERSATIEIYDAAMNRLTQLRTIDGRTDFQFEVSEGESFFVLVKADGNVGLSIDNLIEVQNKDVSVFGTDDADTFAVTDGNTIDITINDTKYSFQQSDVESVLIRGDASKDSANLVLSDRFERTVLRQNRVDSFDGSATLRAVGLKNIDITGAGQLTVAGSDANDTISGNYESMSISDGVSHAIGRGFERMIADGKGGSDTVYLTGDANDEIFFTRNNYGSLRNGSGNLIAIQYDRLVVDTDAGYDVVNLFGSRSADDFGLGAAEARVSNQVADVEVFGFERASAFGNHQNDAIVFTDSEGNDRFLFSDGTTQLVSNGKRLVANDFFHVEANSSSGYDVAQISGTSRADYLNASATSTTFNNSDVSISLNQFDRVNVVADFSGSDHVAFVGSQGADRLSVNGSAATTVFASGAMVRTVGIGSVSFDGNGGSDLAFLTGTSSADQLEANDQHSTFSAGQMRAEFRNVESTRFDGRGGGDSVYVDDARQLDVIAAIGDRAVAVLENHLIEAQGFDFLEVTAVDDVIATYDMEKVDFQSVLRGHWKPK